MTIVNPLVVVDRDMPFSVKPRVWVWENGNVGDDPVIRHQCACAVGMEGFRTPRGVFRIGTRTRKPDWLAGAWVDPPLEPGRVYKFGEEYNPYQHGLINFNVPNDFGYALHGTTNEASIPGAASHGCIRLRKKDILWIYSHVGDDGLVCII